MRVACLVLALMLWTGQARAELQCLPYEVARKVYLLSGYLPDVRAMTRHGEVVIFANGMGGFIQVLVDKNGTACEIFRGHDYGVPKERGA